MRLVGLIILLAGTPALADNPRVADAKKQVDDLDYEGALKSLDAAEKMDGNDRATTLEIQLLRGIAFGTLGKDAKTRDSFRKLLMLDPQATLPADVPPRVRTPFLEAREWSTANGPLTLTPSAELEEGAAKWVVVTAEKDVLRLARVVRFHFGAEVVDVPMSAGKARTPVAGPSVTWWAEVLNERKGVLLSLGSASAPRTDGAALTARVSEPVTVSNVAAETPTGGAWRRPTGAVLLGVGAAAAGVGVAFGVMSSSARAQVTGAARDDAGRVTSLTQREAAALDARAQTQATVANALFIAGGALAAGGLVLIIVGPDGAPTAALAPAPGGAVLTGSF